MARAMNWLIKHPAWRGGLEQIARKASTSPRTLARLFLKETGMTFMQWKTRLILIKAIDRLVQGDSVTEVSLALGYSNTSSFVYMFRSNLGVSPGSYRSHAMQTKYSAAKKEKQIPTPPNYEGCPLSP